jgi:hypothetical protein
VKVLVCIPTITGREETLARCMDSYENTVHGKYELEYSVVVDEPTWGHGVNASVNSALEMCVEPDIIHLTADDLEAHDGWVDIAVETLEKGFYPAPMLLNPDGSVAGFGHGDAQMFDVSRDWKRTDTSVIPTLTVDMWHRMKPMINTHFFSDNYFSHRARLIGYDSVARFGYTFTHHESQVHPGAGMGRAARMQHDMTIYRQYLTTGKLPGAEA